MFIVLKHFPLSVRVPCYNLGYCYELSRFVVFGVLEDLLVLGFAVSKLGSIDLKFLITSTNDLIIMF